MGQVLYRKYRPQTFEEIVGQKHIIGVLKAAMERERISHAYLFSGPRGTGKTTVARIFARAVNCEDAKASDKPCNKCVTCREFFSGSSLDLVEIDAASSRGIDEIRVLREGISVLPFKAKYKVYIIDEVHMLTKEAFNALLKTLEEPPAHIIFILATTEIDKVPETIISRSQHFEFRRILESEIEEALELILRKEGFKAETGALGIIALLSDGSLRDAESMVEQALSYSQGEIKCDEIRLIFGLPSRELLEDFVRGLLEKNTSKLLDLIYTSSKEDIDMKAFLKLLISEFRKFMYFSIDKNYEKDLNKFVSSKEMSFLKTTLARGYDLKNIESILINLNEAQGMIKITHIQQLPLELAVLKISKT